MTKETFEIQTGEKGLSIRTLASEGMDAVEHSVDIGLLNDGDTGSVAPVRELPNVGPILVEEN